MPANARSPGQPAADVKARGRRVGGDPGRPSEGWEAWSPRAGAQGAGGSSRAAFSLLTSSPPRLQQLAHRPRSVAAWGRHPPPRPVPTRAAGHCRMKRLQRDTPGHRVRLGKTLPAERSEDGQTPRPPSAPTRDTAHTDLVRGSRGRQGWEGSGRRRRLAGIPAPCPPPSSHPGSEVNSGQTQRPRRAALTCSSP